MEEKASRGAKTIMEKKEKGDWLYRSWSGQSDNIEFKRVYVARCKNRHSDWGTGLWVYKETEEKTHRILKVEMIGMITLGGDLAIYNEAKNTHFFGIQKFYFTPWEGKELVCAPNAPTFSGAVKRTGLCLIYFRVLAGSISPRHLGASENKDRTSGWNSP